MSLETSINPSEPTYTTEINHSINQITIATNICQQANIGNIDESKHTNP